ncbi:MAG: PAS domain-containing sensor histidine kinase, partial [Vicinamibacterales bacterium]
GLTLATLTLHSTQDVVSLCRRARAAARELGLDATGTRRLCAAVVEIGHAVLAAGSPPAAHLTLSDGPSMQVGIHVRGLAALGGLHAVERSLLRVNRLVHQAVVVSDRPDEADITLSVLFRSVPHGKGQGQPAGPRVARLLEPATSASADDPLDRAHRELIDSNREMVALHAELADQTDRLRLSEEKLHLLLDSVPDYAICMLSPHGVVMTWNAGGERLFGYPADEIIGRSFGVLYLPSDADEGAPTAQLMAAESEGRLESEGLRLRRGGHAFEAHIVLTPIRDDARELRGFSLVIRDITDRKRLEDDLRRRAEDLAVAHRAKEDFLATLSHELRTPLNAMLGWTRLLRIGKLDAAGAARALETIERNAHLQEQLISDILDVSRIVTGKLRLELRPTDLGPIVENTLDTLRPSADAKSITLRSTLATAGTVLGDPDRLEQVVWNLVVNAIKFTPIGGGITVTLERQAGNAVVTVSDTGEGISADVLPYVFDRFRQGDASVTRPHGGLGLGLSMVRHIVELHGGKSSVTSDGRGKGATFMVQLPLRAVRPTRDAGAGGDHLLEGLKVLVVD